MLKYNRTEIPYLYNIIKYILLNSSMKKRCIKYNFGKTSECITQIRKCFFGEPNRQMEFPALLKNKDTLGYSACWVYHKKVHSSLFVGLKCNPIMWQKVMQYFVTQKACYWKAKPFLKPFSHYWKCCYSTLLLQLATLLCSGSVTNNNIHNKERKVKIF